LWGKGAIVLQTQQRRKQGRVRVWYYALVYSAYWIKL
jgi:hypothetical protein